MGEPLLLGLLVVGVAALFVILSYNRFVSQQASIDAAWAGIDVELQRRHDLVRNLVETVRGYAVHESGVLEAVVRSRGEAVRARAGDGNPAGRAHAEDALTDGLTPLLALGEAYPQLQADGAFRDLQQQLIEIEDRVAASRRLFNLEVAAYERRRAAVPSNLVARVFGIPARALFEIRDPAAAHRPVAAF